MKVDEFLASKAKITEQLEQLQSQLAQVRGDVISDIERYIKEFNITFIQMQEIYQNLNLSTATIQFVKAKNVPQTAATKRDIDRSAYAYYDNASGRWFNGYQKIPSWFKVEKADQYLVPGKTHTPLIKKAIQAYGGSQIKEAFTEAQLKGWKESAAQWEKLYDSKKFTILEKKVRSLAVNEARTISTYLRNEVAEFIFESGIL